MEYSDSDSNSYPSPTLDPTPSLGAYCEPWNSKAKLSGGVKLGAPVVTISSRLAVIHSLRDETGLVQVGWVVGSAACLA